MAALLLSVIRPSFVAFDASSSSSGGRPPTHLSAERPRGDRQNAHEGTGKSPMPKRYLR